MIHIRPYQVFTLLKDRPSERVASVMIPARRGWGSTSALETLLLITLLRITEALRATLSVISRDPRSLCT